MGQSLRYKILAAMVLVVIAGIVMTAFNATRSTAGEFQQYVAHGQMMRENRFTVMLTDFYQSGQTWDGVQTNIAQFAAMSGERIVLANPQRIVIADSGQTLIGKTAGTNWNATIVDANGATAGYLYFNPLLDTQTSITDYLASVTRSVWVGALVTVAIAIFATLLLSRAVLHPIEDLTIAVRKMQKGDLSARVDIATKDEVGQLGDAFNAMADSLARQEQLRKNMVSDVAHELRTPVSNIRGYLEAAQDGMISPDMDLVNNLFEEAILLNRLIEDLQELAQAEAGHLRIEIVPMDLREVIQTTIDIMFPAVAEMKQQVSCDFPEKLPLVNADPQRVGQILRNLIGNALDYTPEGRSITVQARTDGKFVQVAVIDTGPGIESEHLPFLFERFYRADASRTRATGGSGLGLAIVKQLVQAQGGRVSVQSVIGHGTTFYFTLPIVEFSI